MTAHKGQSTYCTCNAPWTWQFVLAVQQRGWVKVAVNVIMTTAGKECRQSRLLCVPVYVSSPINKGCFHRKASPTQPFHHMWKLVTKAHVTKTNHTRQTTCHTHKLGRLPLSQNRVPLLNNCTTLGELVAKGHTTETDHTQQELLLWPWLGGVSPNNAS